MTRDSKGRQVPLAFGVVQEVVSPSAERTGLIFLPPSSASGYVVSPQQFSVLAEGYFLCSGSGPIEFTLDEHGSIVRDAWFARPGAGTSGLFLIEVFQ